MFTLSIARLLALITASDIRLCNILATIAEQANGAFAMADEPDRGNAVRDFTRQRVQIRSVLRAATQSDPNLSMN